MGMRPSACAAHAPPPVPCVPDPCPPPALCMRQAVAQLLDDFPSPAHTLEEGGHTPGEGADFLVAEVTDTIPRVRSEQVRARASARARVCVCVCVILQPLGTLTYTHKSCCP